MKVANLKVPAHAFPDKAGQTAWAFEKVEEKLEGRFPIFDKAETVLAIAVPGAAEYTRKQLDELTDWVKRPQIGMQGLVYIKCNADGTLKSSIDKFYSEAQLQSHCNFFKRPCRRSDPDCGRCGRTHPQSQFRNCGWSLGNRLGLRKKRIQAAVGAGFSPF
jgi:aspartyl-tRNA synthetase